MKKHFFILISVGLLSSCSSSLNILNRKYRSGYTFNFSSVKKKERRHKSVEILIAETKLDSLVNEENNFDNVVASIDITEPYINDYKVPAYIMPCDTPPTKKVEKPFSLYKEKEPNKGKVLEPFSVGSFFVVLLMAILGPYVTAPPWIGLLSLFTLFFFSVISLVRIKRHPGKYSKITKILSWIFVVTGGIIALGFLIALLSILLG